MLAQRFAHAYRIFAEHEGPRDARGITDRRRPPVGTRIVSAPERAEIFRFLGAGRSRLDVRGSRVTHRIDGVALAPRPRTQPRRAAAPFGGCGAQSGFEGPHSPRAQRRLAGCGRRGWLCVAREGFDSDDRQHSIGGSHTQSAKTAPRK